MTRTVFAVMSVVGVCSAVPQARRFQRTLAWVAIRTVRLIHKIVTRSVIRNASRRRLTALAGPLSKEQVR